MAMRIIVAIMAAILEMMACGDRFYLLSASIAKLTAQMKAKM